MAVHATNEMDYRVVYTPERACLELLDELPHHETFHMADVMMEGAFDSLSDLLVANKKSVLCTKSNWSFSDCLFALESDMT